MKCNNDENPISAKVSNDTGKWNVPKIVIVMAGLPATGKTFTARNLCRYLRWLGLRTRTFSVAQYRARMLGENLGADFFDPTNGDNLRLRTEVANKCLEDLQNWMLELGQVGILDASNTQAERRRSIHESLDSLGFQVIFLECTDSNIDDELISENIKDYRRISHTELEVATLDTAEAMAEYKKRIAFYRPHYMTVGENGWEKELPFIKVLNGGIKIEVNQLHGYLPSRILYYLMNLHHRPRRIFLIPLPILSLNGGFHSPNGGKTTAAKLIEYLIPVKEALSNRVLENMPDYQVWTETSQIGAILRQVFPAQSLLTKPQLRGRDLGLTENLSPEDINAQFPEESAAFNRDPYYFRYPRAESYHDVAVRLENVMMELERVKRDVLIVADVSVLQCLYAYFCEISNKEICHIAFPNGVMTELRPKAYGVYERKINFNGRIFVGRDLFKTTSESIII